SGRFNAAGDVVLRRDLYKQITRSAYLEGRLGANGEALFTTPGARVGSQFTLPPSGANRSRSQRSGPPVQF
ncbi:MAG: export transporter periplasmic protein LptC, partial [Cyanobacteriota bacterium]